MFQPFKDHFAGFGPNDGTVDFYLRVGTLAGSDKLLLDFGAGRAEWFEDETLELRKKLRLMKGRFGTVIGTDLDPAVMDNQSTDRNVMMIDGRVPLDDQSVDVIVADYVIEHIPDPIQFANEIDRLLKPGGWLCARTPHSLNYVSIAARLFDGPIEKYVMKYAQPDRKEEDIFPKQYKLNTLEMITDAFPTWKNESYVRRSDPSYFFGRKSVYFLLDFIHRLLPVAASGNIFVFIQKPISSE